MFLNILIIALLLAFSTAAKPVLVNTAPVTLPISRHLNFSSVYNVVRHDQSRAHSHKLKGSARARFDSRAAVSEPINNMVLFYTAKIGVGVPPTAYTLIIDTGSSNTWVGAGKAYVKTGTSVQTTNTVAVTYGMSSFSGTEFTDTVSVVPGTSGPNQSIGVASSSTGFQTGIDGVLGIGPVDLTVSTLSPAVCSVIPTITTNLFLSGLIPAASIGMFFVPRSPTESGTGEITWGGTDIRKFRGNITFIPVTTTSPASQFWGYNQSIQYGNSTPLLSTSAGIIDTGSTLILLATDAFNKYKNATGAVFDSNTGLLTMTPTQFSSLQSLFLVAGGVTFEFIPNAQIFPRSFNNLIGGIVGNIYLIVSDLGSNSGEGLDFIMGYTFLERFYSVFDTDNKRIGLATTELTFDSTFN